MSGVKGRSGIYKRKPISEETRKKLSLSATGKKKSREAVLKRSGEKHYLWKGDRVGYGQLHRWVESILGRPKRCDYCKTEEDVRYEWANRDHKYRRIISDWLRLCIKCHRRYDYGNHLSNKGSKWGSIKNKI